ncbi:unnamed protein product [Effrenium voratum]|nr:unnamed protein product [Effrenium voratum]
MVNGAVSSRSRKVAWDLACATPNVLPVADGRILTALGDGGLQYLFGGVKAAVGIKGGCYMFEITILELLDPVEGTAPRGAPASRQLLRVGFTTSEAGVLMDNSAKDQVFLDSLGELSFPGTKSQVLSRKLGRDEVVALVLNLDEDSPEANTLSIFRRGERACEPQKLPESLHGKTLFPTVTFKNMTLDVNFGPSPQCSIECKCTMLQEAADADMENVDLAPDGKPEVIFPLGLPDHGLFDWVDEFLKENPRIVELSERRAVAWAEKSGIPQGPHQQKSQDRPKTNFGIPLLDDGSTHQALSLAAPAIRRDFLVLELNNNLRAKERRRALARFPASDFKRVAVVAMGEPLPEYKARVHELLLAEKAVAREREKRRNSEVLKRRNRKDPEEAKAENGEKAAGEEPAADSEMKDSEEPKAEEDLEQEEPLELNEEEKTQWFRKLSPPDLSSSTLAKSFADYSVPAEDEGFDEIRYVWQSKEECHKIMSDWVLEHKKTMRIEDLIASSWFRERLESWQKQLTEWKKKQSEIREAIKRGEFKKRRKEEKEKPDEEKGEEDAEMKEVKEVNEGEEKDAKETKDEEELNDDDIDVFKVENVMDIGDGRPLFLGFVYEDWVLLNLRYELHLLVHAFRHDVADDDRPSFPDVHLEFYFQKYYRKALNLKFFGVDSNDNLIALIKDTILINQQSRFLEALLPDEEPLDKFARLAEEHRRERQRCIDAGDETAVLKFARPAPPPPARANDYVDPKGKGGKKGKFEGKGKSRDRPVPAPEKGSRGKGPRDGKTGHPRPPLPPQSHSGGRTAGYSRDTTRPSGRQEWRGSGGGPRNGPPAPQRSAYGQSTGGSRGMGGDRGGDRQGQKRPYTPPPPSAYAKQRY